MYTMDQVHRIRELYYEQGKNLAEIAEIVECDWRTVKKYVDMEDFSPHPPAPQSESARPSKLDAYKPERLTHGLKKTRKHRGNSGTRQPEFSIVL